MKSVKYFSNNHKKMIIKYYLIQLKKYTFRKINDGKINPHHFKNLLVFFGFGVLYDLVSISYKYSPYSGRCK